jgi:hypothetical protein
MLDHSLIKYPSWLRGLSTRRPAVEQPAAADVPDVAPDVTRDVAAIASQVRPLLADDPWIPDPPPFHGSATVPPMPDWRPGHPFGMARHTR